LGFDHMANLANFELHAVGLTRSTLRWTTLSSPLAERGLKNS